MKNAFLATANAVSGIFMIAWGLLVTSTITLLWWFSLSTNEASNNFLRDYPLLTPGNMMFATGIGCTGLLYSIIVFAKTSMDDKF